VMKSYFLGGIFYGTFIVATIGTVVDIVGSLEGAHDGPMCGARWALPFVACLSVLMAPAVPLASVWDRHFAAEINVVYQQMISGINKSEGLAAASHEPHSRASSSPKPVIVYIPSPFVMSSTTISLIARWEGNAIVGTAGYYTSTIREHQANLAKSDYAVISELHDSLYPGSTLSPQLIQLIRSDADFDIVSVFQHANGYHTFLFRHRRAASRD
jgi:hypothetical protein